MLTTASLCAVPALGRPRSPEAAAVAPTQHDPLRHAQRGPVQACAHPPCSASACGPVASRFSVRSEPKCSRLRATRTRGTALPCEPSVDGLRAVGLRGQPRLGVRRPGQSTHGLRCVLSGGRSFHPPVLRLRCLLFFFEAFSLSLSLFCLLRPPHSYSPPRPRRRACSAYGTYRCGVAQRKSRGRWVACTKGHVRFFAAAFFFAVVGVVVLGRRLPGSPRQPPPAPSFDDPVDRKVPPLLRSVPNNKKPPPPSPARQVCERHFLKRSLLAAKKYFRVHSCGKILPTPSHNPPRILPFGKATSPHGRPAGTQRGCRSRH